MNTTTILVVDDSEVERLLIEGVLCRNRDYQVILAEDGEDALRKIDENPPTLVLTVLVMPKLDGVALVRAVRGRRPEIPVILMTAYGDESTAVEAFEAGAASYVPKARKAERLLETVDRVARHATAGQNLERLAQCMLEYRGRFELPNDPELIRALVTQIQDTMSGLGYADTVERIRIGEAVEEALLNAMYHGNLETGHEELDHIRSQLDERLLQRVIEERCREPRIRERRILAIVHLTGREARFVVRDEGRGFSRGFFTAPGDSLNSLGWGTASRVASDAVVDGRGEIQRGGQRIDHASETCAWKFRRSVFLSSPRGCDVRRDSTDGRSCGRRIVIGGNATW